MLFWKIWQSEYLSTLSIDNKWSKGESPVVKPGDVVILKPETQEKGQWRLARVINVQNNRDGAIATVNVQLPNSAIFKRSIRQVALLEPSAERLEREPPENPHAAESTLREKTCETGLMETESQPAGAQAQGTEEPRPVPLSGTEEDMATMRAEYTGNADATSAGPGPIAPEPIDAFRDGENVGRPRSERARKHPGYYRRLHEGRL